MLCSLAPCSPAWAKEIAEEEEWDNLTNVFIALDVKEQIKASWGLKTVPHYTLLGADGKILQVRIDPLDQHLAAWLAEERVKLAWYCWRLTTRC